MYQKRLDDIMKKDTLLSNNMDFRSEGDEEGEEESDEESVRLTEIDMNILMNEYKMISEDTQLVVESLKYCEPVNDKSNNEIQHSLNESDIQENNQSVQLPEIDIFAGIMQD